jgi:hypothetical protein
MTLLQNVSSKWDSRIAVEIKNGGCCAEAEHYRR